MKTKAKKITRQKDVYNFWLENKTSGHFTLTKEEIIQKFQEWMKIKDKAWLAYYSSDQCIRFFLTDKDGINSVFDELEYITIYDFLKPSYLHFCYGKE